MSELYVYNKLTEFASASLVITDRLHGLIFSAITNTPCIAFDNLSGKVHGIYHWIEDIPTIRLINTFKEIKENIYCVYGKQGMDVNLHNNYAILVEYLEKCLADEIK